MGNRQIPGLPGSVAIALEYPHEIAVGVTKQRLVPHHQLRLPVAIQVRHFDIMELGGVHQVRGPVAIFQPDQPLIGDRNNVIAAVGVEVRHFHFRPNTEVLADKVPLPAGILVPHQLPDPVLARLEPQLAQPPFKQCQVAGAVTTDDDIDQTIAVDVTHRLAPGSVGAFRVYDLFAKGRAAGGCLRPLPRIVPATRQRQQATQPNPEHQGSRTP